MLNMVDAAPTQPYRVAVDMYSYRTDLSVATHPGIGFNVQDADNFDLFYFR